MQLTNVSLIERHFYFDCFSVFFVVNCIFSYILLISNNEDKMCILVE
jgi:hypothetical protein